ncbi:hypothetical protein EMCRGX_G008789 [Ephydatia muelleri]
MSNAFPNTRRMERRTMDIGLLVCSVDDNILFLGELSDEAHAIIKEVSLSNYDGLDAASVEGLGLSWIVTGIPVRTLFK